jgi:hypothetical protein
VAGPLRTQPGTFPFTRLASGWKEINGSNAVAPLPNVLFKLGEGHSVGQ